MTSPILHLIFLDRLYMWFNILLCAVLGGHTCLSIITRTTLHARLKRAKEEAELLKEQRLSERNGRTKAEKELRDAKLQLSQLVTLDAAKAHVQNETDHDEANPLGGGPLQFISISLPMRPIGILRSCFNKRCGTPRQPLLVPSARAKLTLRPELSLDFLEGLGQYSHCWVLYVFHENTDLQRLWQDSFAGVRAKIRVPRLNGRRLGVFATRAPHRPCPIGLSVAKIVRIQGSTLTLGGTDIVDGSPVLDIKPYIPFCDAISQARTPAWVASEAKAEASTTLEDEPLYISSVELPIAVNAELHRVWQSRPLGPEMSPSLYDSYDLFKSLVLEVLSRDIRSVTQRVKIPARESKGIGVPSLNTSSESELSDSKTGDVGEKSTCLGKWHVILDGIDVSYDVVERTGQGNVVVVRGGRKDS